MPTTCIAGVVISYPHPEDIKTQAQPIIGRAEGLRHDVELRLKKTQKAFEVVGCFTRHSDKTTATVVLEPKEIRLMHEKTVLRCPVGLVQPHYARTLSDWIDEGLYDPFCQANGTAKRIA
jgi:hypothetical protein